MRLRAVFPALLALTFAAGCSTISVETDYDRAADFKRYRTYRWIPHTKGSENNPLMSDPLIKSHVQSSVDAEMAKKGLQKIEEGHPDLLIAYYFTTRNRMDVTHYYGYWYPHTSVYRYKEGTLILDIVDREEKQLIWRGWASGVLENRENLHKQIAYSVEKLLRRYPPKQ
jgi:hypothetical protein